MGEQDEAAAGQAVDQVAEAAPAVEPAQPEPDAQPHEAPVVDPAPEKTADSDPPPVRQDPVPTSPFIAYGALWAIFAGWVVWQFSQVPADAAVFDAALYPASMFVGMVLTIAGPLLCAAVWFASWGKAEQSKLASLSSAAIKGSVATLVGVVLWWLALMVVDLLRMGRVL